MGFLSEGLKTGGVSIDLSVTIGGVRQTQRVVPRYQAIKDIPGVMPCEDMRAIAKKNYEGVRRLV